jgi:hypothetical protein
MSTLFKLIYMYLICKKSLYKSTYKKNAFSKNKGYLIQSEDEKFINLIDNEKRYLTFQKLLNRHIIILMSILYN